LKPYRLSLTGADAMIPEFVRIAQWIHQGNRMSDLDPAIVGREKKVTNQRKLRELKRRIEKLTPKQIEILVDGDPDSQKQITHLALCKSYRIYHDFVTEVLAEKIQVFDHQLTELDYNSFISRKKTDDQKLDEAAEATHKYVKQIIFKMLHQVEIIDSLSNPIILSQRLNSKTENAIIEDSPKWLTCFLYNEQQIASLT